MDQKKVQLVTSLFNIFLDENDNFSSNWCQAEEAPYILQHLSGFSRKQNNVSVRNVVSDSLDFNKPIHRRIPSVLLVGNTKSGKSTTAYRISWYFWKLLRNKKSEVDDVIWTKESVVPIYINLRKIENEDKNKNKPCLGNILETFINLNIAYFDAVSGSWLTTATTLLRTMKLLLIMDNFDQLDNKVNLWEKNNWSNATNFPHLITITLCSPLYFGKEKFDTTRRRNDQYFENVDLFGFCGQKTNFPKIYFLKKFKKHVVRKVFENIFLIDFLIFQNIPDLLSIARNPFFYQAIIDIVSEQLLDCSILDMDFQVKSNLEKSIYEKIIRRWGNIQKLKISSLHSTENPHPFYSILNEIPNYIDAYHRNISLAWAAANSSFCCKEKKYGMSDLLTLKWCHWLPQSRQKEVLERNTLFPNVEKDKEALRENLKNLRSLSMLEWYPKFESQDSIKIQIRWLDLSFLEYFVNTFIFLGVRSQMLYFGEDVNFSPNRNNIRGVRFEEALQKLVETTREDWFFATDLNNVILESRRSTGIHQISANAMTILCHAGYSMIKKDYRNVLISGSDLFGGHFTGTNFSGADMKDCRLSMSNFTQANFNGADWRGVDFLSKLHTIMNERDFSGAVQDNVFIFGYTDVQNNEPHVFIITDNIMLDKNLCNDHTEKMFMPLYLSSDGLVASKIRDKVYIGNRRHLYSYNLTSKEHAYAYAEYLPIVRALKVRCTPFTISLESIPIPNYNRYDQEEYEKYILVLKTYDPVVYIKYTDTDSFHRQFSKILSSEHSIPSFFIGLNIGRAGRRTILDFMFKKSHLIIAVQIINMLSIINIDLDNTVGIICRTTLNFKESLTANCCKFSPDGSVLLVISDVVNILHLNDGFTTSAILIPSTVSLLDDLHYIHGRRCIYHLVFDEDNHIHHHVAFMFSSNSLHMLVVVNWFKNKVVYVESTSMLSPLTFVGKNPTTLAYVVRNQIVSIQLLNHFYGNLKTYGNITFSPNGKYFARSESIDSTTINVQICRFSDKIVVLEGKIFYTRSEQEKFWLGDNNLICNQYLDEVKCFDSVTTFSSEYATKCWLNRHSRFAFLYEGTVVSPHLITYYDTSVKRNDSSISRIDFGKYVLSYSPNYKLINVEESDEIQKNLEVWFDLKSHDKAYITFTVCSNWILNQRGSDTLHAVFQTIEECLPIDVSIDSHTENVVISKTILDILFQSSNSETLVRIIGLSNNYEKDLKNIKNCLEKSIPMRVVEHVTLFWNIANNNIERYVSLAPEQTNILNYEFSNLLKDIKNSIIIISPPNLKVFEIFENKILLQHKTMKNVDDWCSKSETFLINHKESILLCNFDFDDICSVVVPLESIGTCFINGSDGREVLSWDKNNNFTNFQLALTDLTLGKLIFDEFTLNILETNVNCLNSSYQNMSMLKTFLSPQVRKIVKETRFTYGMKLAFPNVKVVENLPDEHFAEVVSTFVRVTDSIYSIFCVRTSHKRIYERQDLTKLALVTVICKHNSKRCCSALNLADNHVSLLLEGIYEGKHCCLRADLVTIKIANEHGVLTKVGRVVTTIFDDKVRYEKFRKKSEYRAYPLSYDRALRLFYSIWEDRHQQREYDLLHNNCNTWAASKLEIVQINIKPKFSFMPHTPKMFKLRKVKARIYNSLES